MTVDIVVDNCAICRNHIMDLCKILSPGLIFYDHLGFCLFVYLFCGNLFCGCVQALSAKPIRQVQPVRSALSLGVCFMFFFKYRMNLVSYSCI